jgi:methylenetetrahydrofolate dehydrogenase (NADP+)/methenyltetrahydrofolate cyclohydrolase
MVDVFDGKKFVADKTQGLENEVTKLLKEGIKPVLVSILVGDDPASKLYVGLKKKAGERMGINVRIVNFDSGVGRSEIVETIKKINEDDLVHGIMVQLPLPPVFSEEDKKEIIDTILPTKDVDGLRSDSLFIHPTSKAILDILEQALELEFREVERLKICVVGATGMVGEPLVRELKKTKHEVLTADSATPDLKSETEDADVIISCAGVSGLIKKEMVKEGVVLIDVGAPLGDVGKDVYEKASFVSPVPGGVGPVTVFSLMENLILAAKSAINTPSL